MDTIRTFALRTSLRVTRAVLGKTVMERLYARFVARVLGLLSVRPDEKFLPKMVPANSGAFAKPVTVDIVVPTAGLTRTTDALLSQLVEQREEILDRRGFGKIEIWVADDAVQPEDRSKTREICSRLGLRYIETPSNVGFLPNMNLCWDALSGDWLFMLNSDVVVGPGFLRRALDHIAADNASLITFPAFEDWSGWGAGFDHWLELDRELAGTIPQQISACTAVGYAMAVRRSSISGSLFDPVYGRGYGEDSDLHYRLTTQGLLSVLALNVCVMHLGGATFDREFGIDGRRVRCREIFMRRWGYLYSLEFPFFLNSMKRFLLQEGLRDCTPTKSDLAVLVPKVSPYPGGLEVAYDFIMDLLVESGMPFSLFSLDTEDYSRIFAGGVRVSQFPSHESSSVATGVRARVSIEFGTAVHRAVNMYPALPFAERWGVIQGPDFLIQPIDQRVFSEAIVSFTRCFSNSPYSTRIASFFGAAHVIEFGLSAALDAAPVSKVSPADAQDVLVLIRPEHGKQPWLAVAVANFLASVGRNVLAVVQDFSLVDSFGLGESVRRVGRLEREQFRSALLNSAVFFDSSAFEGYGMVSRQALRQGASVVAVRNGGNLALEDHERVRLVESWDFPGIISAIQMFLDSDTTVIQPDTVTDPEPPSLSQVVVASLGWSSTGI